MQSWILDVRYNPVIKNITSHLAGMLPLLLRKTANCCLLYSKSKIQGGRGGEIKKEYISRLSNHTGNRQCWVRKEHDRLNRHHFHCQFNVCYAFPVQQKIIICQGVKFHRLYKSILNIKRSNTKWMLANIYFLKYAAGFILVFFYNPNESILAISSHN